MIPIQPDDNSALLVIVAQLLDSVAHRSADTESAKEPVVRVATIVVEGTAEAAVVVAILACCGRDALGPEVELRGPR